MTQRSRLSSLSKSQQKHRKERESFVLQDSHLGLPTRGILASPQSLGCRISCDVTIRRISVDDTSRAVSNIAKMAQQRTLVGDFDIRVGQSSRTDPIEKISEMIFVTTSTIACGDFFPLHVVHDITGSLLYQ